MTDIEIKFNAERTVAYVRVDVRSTPLEEITEKLYKCPVCGEAMDFSQSAEELNELDERDGNVLGIRNGTEVFRYICGHKSVVEPI